MKTFRVFTFQMLACCYFLTAAAHASDELIVYVFENGSPLSGVDVQLDDQIIGNTRADGSVRGDLDGGGGQNDRVHLLQPLAQIDLLLCEGRMA